MIAVDVAIGVIFSQGGEQMLICRRKADTILGGYWEFPGGKRDPHETLQECLKRELREEIGIEVEILGALSVIEHQYTHGIVRLHPFICRHVANKVQLLAVAEAKWIQPSDAKTFRFPEANVQLMQAASLGFTHLLSVSVKSA